MSDPEVDLFGERNVFGLWGTLRKAQVWIMVLMICRGQQMSLVVVKRQLLFTAPHRILFKDQRPLFMNIQILYFPLKSRGAVFCGPISK